MPEKSSGMRYRRKPSGVWRHKVQAYVTPEEFSRVREAADRLGMSISAFASTVVTREAERFMQQEEESPRKDAPATRAKPRLDLLLQLRGIGKKTFEALGGGEAFLKAERASWSKLDERE